ncbi:alpha/beta hydrolase [Microbispora sp. NPDC046933]|uniref:alpha/beta fold hydrolase n=1 Tax=Microbispora sp. NPDC046933 TaxID=3155618 RepID=UPI0033E60BCA
MSTHRIWHTSRGHGFPIVMIHGYTVDHRLLLPLEPAFEERPGYRRLYLDLPGHGKSPRLPGRTTASSLTDAVCEWIVAALGDEPFAVVGQSFGGQIAREVTARLREQVTGMALLAPVVKWGAQRRLPEQTILGRDTAFLRGLPDPEREVFGLVMAQLDRERWDAFSEHLLPGWRLHDREAAAELESDFLLPAAPEEQRQTHRGPHLLVTARQDAVVGWRDQLSLMDHYPHMATAVIDGSGHNPQIETPDTVLGLFVEWLIRLERSGLGHAIQSR